MGKNSSTKAAWIGLIATISAALIAGIFAIITSNKPKPSPPPDKDSDKTQPAQNEPPADSIQILSASFQGADGAYIGGRAKVAFSGKGPIQSSMVTTCLLVSPPHPCANISFFPITPGIHDYPYTIASGAGTEATVLLCIGKQDYVVGYLEASPQVRTSYFEPVCVQSTVKR